jgi:protoporphyrinogen oxidase
MSGTADRPVVIVGAGVSGLSLAVRLAERGVETVVVERESRPGGLARSFCYDGFTFDIGPHRFHTYDPAVERFLRATLGSSVREISRSSKLHFRGRFYPWPLHPSLVLLRFPPGIALGVVRDLLRGYPRHHAASFREQIIGMYGETPTGTLRGYSTSSRPPELTHVDWANRRRPRHHRLRLQIQSLWRLA